MFANFRDIRDLNPHLYGGEMWAQNMIYESLVMNTEKGVAPWLAEKWDISDDGKVYNFYLRKECLGLVGESGSGKSTLGRMMIGVQPPDRGQVLFDGQDIYNSVGLRKKSEWRKKISAVFQDYTSSVNPCFQVKDIIGEPIQTHHIASVTEKNERIVYLLEKVGLDGNYLKRYPHELSGGQLQRVCIARAISTHPAFILLDEPVSSLDVSVQVQVMDLLLSLKEEFNLSYLFISHDLAAVTYFCDRALFFAEGEIVEEVPRMMELGQIKAAYSRKLLHSVLDFTENLPDCRCGLVG